MPYLTPLDKVRMDEGADPHTAGELNYLLTQVAIRYLQTNMRSYQTMNDIVGAFECAKQEFLRRVVADYENGKIKSNGDVYTLPQEVK